MFCTEPQVYNSRYNFCSYFLLWDIVYSGTNQWPSYEYR